MPTSFLPSDTSSQQGQGVHQTGSTSLLIAGFGCSGASLVSWLIALSRYPLSLACPLLSLSYVVVYLAAAAWPVLAEPLSEARTVGIAMIVVGVALVARSSPVTAEES